MTEFDHVARAFPSATVRTTIELYAADLGAAAEAPVANLMGPPSIVASASGPALDGTAPNTSLLGADPTSVRLQNDPPKSIRQCVSHCERPRTVAAELAVRAGLFRASSNAEFALTHTHAQTFINGGCWLLLARLHRMSRETALPSLLRCCPRVSSPPRDCTLSLS